MSERRLPGLKASLIGLDGVDEPALAQCEFSSQYKRKYTPTKLTRTPARKGTRQPHARRDSYDNNARMTKPTNPPRSVPKLADAIT
mmetsp:Transcript_41757/g.50862  ORF Transcript_41757/g.50862 Transcript_41757/m.50862 type:complete len:86 (+) Transcript_41757:833-1090(+)